MLTPISTPTPQKSARVPLDVPVSLSPAERTRLAQLHDLLCSYGMRGTIDKDRIFVENDWEAHAGEAHRLRLFERKIVPYFPYAKVRDPRPTGAESLPPTFLFGLTVEKGRVVWVVEIAPIADAPSGEHSFLPQRICFIQQARARRWKSGRSVAGLRRLLDMLSVDGRIMSWLWVEPPATQKAHGDVVLRDGTRLPFFECVGPLGTGIFLWAPSATIEQMAEAERALRASRAILSVGRMIGSPPGYERTTVVGPVPT